MVTNLYFARIASLRHENKSVRHAKTFAVLWIHNYKIQLQKIPAIWRKITNDEHGKNLKSTSLLSHHMGFSSHGQSCISHIELLFFAFSWKTKNLHFSVDRSTWNGARNLKVFSARCQAKFLELRNLWLHAMCECTEQYSTYQICRETDDYDLGFSV